LIERGLDASLSYLFVIDGGKALRSAIDEMFGERAKVQRCRTHYADLRVMPTRRCSPCQRAANEPARSA
jgi:transposase-like protein